MLYYNIYAVRSERKPTSGGALKRNESVAGRQHSLGRIIGLVDMSPKAIERERFLTYEMIVIGP